jgi:site-specific DNA-methyltransferase (adenine-specific)
MGTGTTAVAAKKLGRNWMGFELQQDYIDVANIRIGDVENN